MNKKFFFYFPNFNIGGAEKNIINIANEAYLNDFEIKVLVNNDFGLLKKFLNKNIEIYTLNQNNKLICIIKLIFYILKQKPDYIFSILECSAIAAVVKIFTKRKTIFINRICNTISPFLNSQKNKIVYVYQYILNYLIVLFSDIILVQNNYMKIDLINVYNLKKINKIHILNNCLNIDILRKNSSENYNFNFIKKGKKIIFVTNSSLRPQKNLFEMIKIFKKLSFNYKNIFLIIIGDGKIKLELINFINKLNLSSSIHITGFETNPHKIVSKCDYYLSTSYFEGTSNSILEALYFGIPVISSNCPSGIEELINHNNGILVEQTELEENFVIALEKILSGQINFATKKKISYPIEERYNEKKIFKNLIEILNA